MFRLGINLNYSLLLDYLQKDLKEISKKELDELKLKAAKDIDKQIEFLKEVGLNGLEFNLEYVKDERELKILKEKIEKEGLRISFHAPTEFSFDLTSPFRFSILKTLKKFASVLDYSNLIVLHPLYARDVKLFSLKQDEERRKRLDLLISSLKNLSECETHLGLENGTVFTYACDSEDLNYVLDKVGKENLSVVPDPAHFYHMHTIQKKKVKVSEEIKIGEEIKENVNKPFSKRILEELRNLRSHIVEAHLANYDEKLGWHVKFGVEGIGFNKPYFLKNWLKVLKHKASNSWQIIEWMPNDERFHEYKEFKCFTKNLVSFFI